MAAIRDLLRDSHTIAVVGLSSKKFRPSHGVAEYMQKEGYRIIPVNPNETEVLGEKSYARIEDIPEHIDIVDIFRRPEFVGPLVDSAIQIGAGVIWMYSSSASFRRGPLTGELGPWVGKTRWLNSGSSRERTSTSSTNS